MPLSKIVHLIDDTNPGGVMRVLDHLKSTNDLAQNADHQVQSVRRERLSYGILQADIIVSHLSVSWRTLPALMALRSLHSDKKIIHVEHSYTRAFTTLNVKHRKRFSTMLRTGYAMFDKVIAVSHAQAKWMRDLRLVQRHQLGVIASAVDLSAFAQIPFPTAAPRIIGAVGRLHPQKGFDCLIKAFRQSPDINAELHIYGDGPERAALSALAAQDFRIKFKGYIKTPTAAYKAVDAIAMPSRWEAFGLVALEARAAGRHVLASDVDGLGDQIGAGVTRVAGHSVYAWQHALRDVVRQTPSQAEQTMARNAAMAHSAAFLTQWRSLTAAASADQLPQTLTTSVTPQAYAFQ